MLEVFDHSCILLNVVSCELGIFTIMKSFISPIITVLLAFLYLFNQLLKCFNFLRHVEDRHYFICRWQVFMAPFWRYKSYRIFL